MTSDVRVCADVNELALRAGEAAVLTVADTVRRRGRCSIVLSGGDTPRALYALLASTFRDQIAWANVDVFWGDERYVPADAPDSNYRMARETLLDHVPCPPANIHPMATTSASPEAAAEDYERTLRHYFRGKGPLFDLIFLGLGHEGHTASLFPGSSALNESTRWVLATQTPAQPSTRLTLTLPAITQAANIYVLAAGTAKAAVLHRVLTGPPNPYAYPAAGIRSATGHVIWWLDRDAAMYLADGSRAASQSSFEVAHAPSELDRG